MSVEEQLVYLSLAEAGRLIQRRALGVVELTRAYLHRIEAVDGRLHCYMRVLADSAMTEARAADKEILDGKYRGPLHGIPIALKDLYDTRGIPTTGASRVFSERIPTEDATTTARLKAAGCVLLGKLTMSELAMTGPPGFGEEARNPWNIDHMPGWSSIGSGVAVAAGLCAGALGSDTGGSIRFPASYNGIVGLLPTYGRVSRCGVMPLSWSLDHAGPMTRTVEDTALMLQVIAGADPRDPTASAAPVPDYSAALEEGVEGLTIGVMTQAERGVHPETWSAVERAIDDLARAGARIEEVEIASLEHVHIAACIIYLSEGFTIYQDVLRTRSEELSQVFRIYGYLGGLFTAADYVQAQRLRSRLKREVSGVFQNVDVIALPSTARPPAALADFDPFVLTEPTRSAPSEVFNLVGCPAISVPCGFSEARLPLGLQIAGRPFDEATVLRVAYTYQQLNPFHRQHPPV